MNYDDKIIHEMGLNYLYHLTKKISPSKYWGPIKNDYELVNLLDLLDIFFLDIF